MIPASEVTKALDETKKRSIIEQYLRGKYKEAFNPHWLDNMDNYGHLANAIDFFYNLNNDNLNIIAIGSDNLETRKTHEAQFNELARLLDKLVVFTGVAPPVATSFNERDAILVGLDLNQRLASRSLRDLHAQSSNLGVAEKLLNGDLGPTEWLGEVDLERLLIKMGVKDRVHITRLTAEDIGMVLHFERVKHANATVPYTIPLLINRGSTDSLRSQGSHWTYAMVTVDPTANSVTIAYQDSMALSGTEQGILTAAIDYTDGLYSAFPGTTKTVTPASDNLQRDGWSCGYRALRGLLTAPGFPTHGGVTAGPAWIQFTGAEIESYALRNAAYQLLLSDLEIDPDYFEAMKLDDEVVGSSKSGKKYEVDKEFTKHYMDLLLVGGSKTKPVITTNHFEKEYQAILKQMRGKIETERTDSIERLNKNIKAVVEAKDLSPDAKIIALLNVYADEYAQILKSSGGSGSNLGKYLKTFCEKNFGVELGKEQNYRIKKDGLMMRVFKSQLDVKPEHVDEESLLPPVKKTEIGVTETSKSTPVVGSERLSVSTTVSKSVDQVVRRDLSQPQLRTDKELTRLGSMFGSTQFCYAEKPGGVEPGFRAIDLNAAFFKELQKILAEENLPSLDKLSLEARGRLAELRVRLSTGDLEKNRIDFATFINVHVSGPHSKSVMDPGVRWLCNEVKEAVAKNNKLSAWMYKLDYAEGQKKRIDANKEAIREFVGTRLAGIFSDQNQKQEIAWVNNGKKGAHALLACGWKNGLQELRQFLHGGDEPDYNGILVEDRDAPIKRSKNIPGLGKNLIFGIAIGDRDGMGKEAQNKGFAEGAFYGFDYGKPYEGNGVCSSLKDDFSFEDTAAKMPAIFRGSSKIGIARHFMYRNYSVFYDTPLSDRMLGVHLLRKMITGDNPSEEVIKSYPGLRQELNRIQERTPSAKNLLNRLADIRAGSEEGSKLQGLVDTYIVKISTGKLTPFAAYFAEIKIDLINEALKNKMPYDELEQYLTFIGEMEATAAKSNERIIEVFQQRVLLTSHEIDLLDKLEKIFSPTSVMSHDGTVFLNTMRFDPSDKRIPFELTRKENGDYILSTSKPEVAAKFKELFGIDLIKKSGDLSICTVPQEGMLKLMFAADEQYHQKREQQLIRPTYEQQTIPMLVSLMNHGVGPQRRVSIVPTWHEDGSLSLRVTAKTPDQIRKIEEIFGVEVNANEVQLIEVLPEGFMALQKKIVVAHKETEAVELAFMGSSRPKTDVVNEEMSTRWKTVKEKAAIEEPSTSTTLLLDENKATLITRMKKLITHLETQGQLEEAIGDITSSADIEKLMSYNDKTLTTPENIQCIIEDRLSDIKVVPEAVVTVVPTTTDNPTTERRTTLF
ncbi:TPA: hypothetical protein ACPSKE_000263 [Legionella feeleii]